MENLFMRITIILSILLIALTGCKSMGYRSKESSLDVNSLETPPYYPKDLPSAMPYAAS